jgi:hypothetical protein
MALIQLPDGWYNRLADLVVPKWRDMTAFLEERPSLCHPRTLDRVHKERNNHITEKLLQNIAARLGVGPTELQIKLGKPALGSESRPTLRIAELKDVEAWGWDRSGHKLLDELIAIDHEVIDGLTDRDEGKTEQWAPVFMHHPDSWRLLVAGPGEIVGYWHFVPLFEADFQKAKNGELYDSEVTADTVRPFELPGVYNMYITMFGVKAQYRRGIGVTMLFNSFLELLAELATSGIFFREVCANAYSKHGAALCRNFGMKTTQAHVSTGDVYARSVYPFPSEDIFKQSPKLIELYEGRFGSPESKSTVR